MDKQIIFKSAISGFEKKAVLDYIYKLNQSSEEARANLEKKLLELASEKEALDAKLRQAETAHSGLLEKYNNISDSFAAEAKRNEEMNAAIAELNAEVENQKNLVAGKTNEIIEHLRINTELKLNNEEYSKKADEVNHASTQIGRLIIDAHTEAENIIDAAQNKADIILAEAKKNANEITSSAEIQAGSALEDSRSRISAIVDEANEKAEKLLESAEAESQRLIAESKTIYTQRIDAAQRAVDSALEKFSLYRTQVMSINSSVMDALADIHEKTATIAESIDSAQGMIHSAGALVIDDYEESDSHSFEYADYVEDNEEQSAEDAFRLETENVDESNKSDQDSCFFRFAAEE